ncbi:MAG: CGNR zinc finger domain-containing protein [Saonia sp.]
MVNKLKLNPGSYSGSYKVIGVELCFDFANTVSWRNRENPHEWLNSFENLSIWCQLVGILDEYQSKQLIDHLTDTEKTASQVLLPLYELREAIFRIFTSIADNEDPLEKDIAYLNDFSKEKIQKQKVVYNKGEFTLVRSKKRSSFDKILHEIYDSVIYVMTHIDLTRIKKCTSCEWLFHDISRNRSRRWCVMEDCGNRNKVNSFNKRQRKLQL